MQRHAAALLSGDSIARLLFLRLYGHCSISVTQWLAHCLDPLQDSPPSNNRHITSPPPAVSHNSLMQSSHFRLSDRLPFLGRH